MSAESGRDGKGELRVFDAVTGEEVLTREFAHGHVFSLAYNGAGTLLAVAVGDIYEAGVIQLLDPDTGRERLSLAGHHDRIWKLAFSPDGRRLASLALVPDAGVGGEAVGPCRRPGIVDPPDILGRPHWECPLLEDSGFAFSPDGDRLSFMPAGRRRDAEVQVWDATPLPEDRAPSVP